MRAIVARHPGRTVAVVTHSGIISQVLGAMHGLSPAAWEPFRPGNASITEVRWDDGGGTVLRFDDRAHLDALRSPETVRLANMPQVGHGSVPGDRAGTLGGLAPAARYRQLVTQRTGKRVAGAAEPVGVA